MSNLPIFVSGIGRSGTSAVIAALCKHREVRAPQRIGEAPFVKAMLEFLRQYEDLSPNKDYNLKNCRLSAKERASEFSRLMENMQYGLYVGPDVEEERFWIGKVSLSEELFMKAEQVLEQVRIVYIMRNGVEVVNSAKNFKGFSDLSFEQLCRRWRDNIAEATYLEGKPLCSIIRHDQMVADPVSVFARVFERLGLFPDASPADFISSTFFNSSFDARDTDPVTQAASKFAGRLDCWSEWTEDQKELFIDLCDETMLKFEFERPYVSALAA